ncbi:MAG: hypothetical protein QNJ18_14365, partial [Xenococcaceae cyanobacterium MO_167.B52]|nr:hypothetical protein [Xenococcaceae cyanobacterium MO_167.B52]
THIQIFQVRFCTNLQQFLARFLALESIIQLLKPLVYKDFVSKLLAQLRVLGKLMSNKLSCSLSTRGTSEPLP